jgi:hypothetical protein
MQIRILVYDATINGELAFKEASQEVCWAQPLPPVMLRWAGMDQRNVTILNALANNATATQAL